MKKKVFILILIVVILVTSISTVGIILYQNKQKELELQEKLKKEKEEKELFEAIKSSYNEKVITTKETKLYKLVDGKYKEIGKVSSDTNLLLEFIEEPKIDNKYFKLLDEDYYVLYDSVKPNEEMKLDDDYKNYVPFDNDVITKNPANFYISSNMAFTINEEIQLPIIINENSNYYVEFNSQLISIKKEDIKETKSVPKNTAVATNIGVLNYHFFYNPRKGEYCDQTICLDTARFEEHLKYLKDNGFYTATMKDMSLWMEKKIRLPKKTTVITIDDGAMGTDTHLIDLLEKYDLHGTLFLITAWWPKEKYISDNLEIQSHGNDIHTNNGAITRGNQQLLNDLNQSIQKLDGEKTAFCYPFYMHDGRTKEIVKQAGFKLAFVGGNIKVNQNHDPYQMYRYVIFSYTSVNDLMYMVN